MIIKGLCGRYERWNPVHPTYGSFWGMGIGFGCGVGWGPGFGPEVIGYVGAGCGVGFSVGITLAGFGIGLPANYVFEVPYKALMATASGLNEFGSITGNGWNIVEPHISDFQRKMSGSISSIKHESLFNKGVDLCDETQLEVKKTALHNSNTKWITYARRNKNTTSIKSMELSGERIDQGRGERGKKPKLGLCLSLIGASKEKRENVFSVYSSRQIIEKIKGGDERHVAQEELSFTQVDLMCETHGATVPLVGSPFSPIKGPLQPRGGLSVVEINSEDR